MATPNKPTMERILEELEYRPSEGDFVWRRNKGRKVCGAVAGWVDNLNYRLIRLDGVLYRAHHMVIFVETGIWPDSDVDHIDGNPANNKIQNLRVCSHAENQKNMRTHKDNTSGFKGVFWSKTTKKWMSQICVNGKQKYLGLFADKVSAARAYDQAAISLHGKFAKLNEA